VPDESVDVAGQPVRLVPGLTIQLPRAALRQERMAMSPSDTKDAAKARAEERFKKAERLRSGEAAVMAGERDRVAAQGAKTAKLRQLRLAKEAADDAEPKAPVVKKKAAAKPKPRA
jgi:uncharacterized protein with von Willebrand factor type A (vWA) domain